MIQFIFPRYILPSKPNFMVEDPLSICEEYDSPTVHKWRLVTALLLQKPIMTTKVLLDVISSLQPDCDFESLCAVIQSSEVGREIFFTTTLPAMLKVALRMPELFPTGELKVLSPGEDCSVVLTREQTACLLVHMFFCTLQPQKCNKYWVNFSVWYGSKSPPVIAYLHTLLAYFSQLDSSGQPPHSQEPILFHRRVLTSPPNWISSPTVLCHIIPSQVLEPEANTEVVFSNKDVGFGVSGTQEEVKFGMNPEACVAMLVVPTLKDNETLVIQGVRKTARHEGIGRDVKYIGLCTEEQAWSSRCLIAMDALELDAEETEDPIPELREEVLMRELNKAYCGFAPFRGKPFSSIATGHWGCGAFGGHKYAKALIQVMAASESRTTLVFHDIQTGMGNSDFLDQLMSFCSHLSQSKVTVGILISAMITAGKKTKFQSLKDPDLLHQLKQILALKVA